MINNNKGDGMMNLVFLEEEDKPLDAINLPLDKTSENNEKFTLSNEVDLSGRSTQISSNNQEEKPSNGTLNEPVIETLVTGH